MNIQVGDRVRCLWSPSNNWEGVVTALTPIIDSIHSYHANVADICLSIRKDNGSIQDSWVCRFDGRYGRDSEKVCFIIVKRTKPEDRARVLKHLDAQLAKLDPKREKDKARIARLTEKRQRVARQ